MYTLLAVKWLKGGSPLSHKHEGLIHQFGVCLEHDLTNGFFFFNKNGYEIY
jgi:hypothetical protein